ncbi:protease Do-like 2, chloroplastic isoform X2 [Durio zibethinus]|uniref:Protease Do-like 2, chloroplastic isoform X2 n=1 Tax=Durio zibethinus TaxID=66656 RepID=A0A6P6B1I5_DURZI|nr:protease Do-like 2, chloroplastic isoform X2 [Durio zibethinus]
MKAIQNLLQLLGFLPSAYRPFHLHSLFLPQRALLTLKRSSSTSPPKSNAEVLARGVDCDIVLLSVESKEYWKGAKPLRLGHLQRLQFFELFLLWDILTEDHFSDKGLSCIEVYRSEDAQHIGYVIPTMVVSYFLNDYERNGKCTGTVQLFKNLDIGFLDIGDVSWLD